MRTAIVCVSVMLLCASAVFGGVISYIPITNDADSDISFTKVYTHALDLGVGDAGALVNLVRFTLVHDGNVDAMPNFDYTVETTEPPDPASTRNNFGNNAGHNVSGNVVQLFSDFMFNGGNAPGGVATLTLSGLTVGTTYDTRVYTRAFGGPGRVALIDFENDGLAGPDDSVTLDQGDALANPPDLDTVNRSYALSYQFTAQTDQLTIAFTQVLQNTSWHQYGVTNEVVGAVSGLVEITTLFNTGVDESGLVLAPGTPDPHYELVGTGPATVGLNHPAYLANDAAGTEGSSWVSLVANLGTENVEPGNYSYLTSFDLSGLDPDSAQLFLTVAVDDQLQDVLLNGVSTGITTAGFGVLNGLFILDSGFQGGVNTLEFLTVNGGEAANPHGLRVELSGTAKVPEPSTLVLAALALLGLACVGWRKRAK